MFVFHIFHYFSAPTDKKNHHTTTIDTMTEIKVSIKTTYVAH
jgi:hypothetical protein